MLKKRTAAAIAAIGLLGPGALVATAQAAPVAASKKCDTKQTYYYVKGGHEVYVGTNLYSEWLEGPGRITYQKTATSEANSAWSGDLGVSINLVIGEISNKTATFPVKNRDYLWILIGQS